ncbi:GNAT family N-acetyltransferase [Massilia sp. H-1]|nr:GNAT family N-acetyltransferase [Massilia sp. H-1]
MDDRHHRRSGARMKWTLRPASEFAALSGQWAQLHVRCQASPMLAVEFVAPLIAEFGSGAELLAVCEHEARTVAMALVAPQGRGAWASFQPSPGADRPVAAGRCPCPARVAGRADGRPARPAAGVRPDPVRPRSAGAPARLAPAAHDGLHRHGENYHRFKQFRRLLECARQEPARKSEKTAHKARQGCRGPAPAGQPRPAGRGRSGGRLRLYSRARGWKADGGTAVNASKQCPGTLLPRHARRLLLKRGAGSIYRYWFGQQLVAMDLCIEDERQIIVLKTTYDESVPNSLSPTLLMREEACRAVCRRPPGAPGVLRQSDGMAHALDG